MHGRACLPMQRDSHEETHEAHVKPMHVIEAFRGNMCDRSHLHHLIQGSEGGIRLSVWCQCYPAPMVDLLVEGQSGAWGGQ